jgi:hypothetical protein
MDIHSGTDDRSMLNLNDLTRKLNTFRRDPIGVANAKIHSIRQILNMQTLARARLARNGALDIITDFVSKRPQGALPPVYTHLWCIYRMVRKRKPCIVLEFGSGCSTLIIAKALSDNNHGYLYSVDSSREWADSTLTCMPNQLRGFFEISCSAISAEAGDSGFRLLKHEQVPEVIPNFVFLDGPPLAAGEVAVDLLGMEDRLPQDFMLVVDKRRENTEFLKKHLKRHYTIEHGELTIFKLQPNGRSPRTGSFSSGREQ